MVFPCEFCDIFKNTLFCRTPLVAASMFQIKGKLNGKILKGGFNFVGNELISLHQYYFEVYVRKSFQFYVTIQ